MFGVASTRSQARCLGGFVWLHGSNVGSAYRVCLVGSFTTMPCGLLTPASSNYPPPEAWSKAFGARKMAVGGSETRAPSQAPFSRGHLNAFTKRYVTATIKSSFYKMHIFFIIDVDIIPETIASTNTISREPRLFLSSSEVISFYR